MGAVWLPICCAASVSFRKFSEMNQLLSSTLSIKVINGIKHSQLFKSAVVDQDRVTSSQIIKILKHSSNNKSMTEDLNIVGFNRRIKMFSFKDNVIKYFLIGIRSLGVYRHSIRYKPLNPLYFTFVITFIVAISVIKNDNSYRALIIVSYFAIYTFFFHALQVFFYKNVKNWIWLVILCDVLNIASLCVTGYLLYRYYDFFNDLNTSMITTYAVVITLYLFLYCLGHISQSASIKYTQHRDNLEKYLNSGAFKLKVLNQELEKDALKWGQIIHGKIQSKVISSSIKETNATGNQVLVDDRFLGEIKDLISDSLTGSPQKVANLTQIIEIVSKPWSAVIDMQSEIDPSIANESLSPSITQRVTDVLEEAINNAVKHGGAEQVWLVIKAYSNDSLQIQVKNDGAPVGKPKRASIGTNLFNQSGIWSIGNENGLVVFKIQINI
jgi:signal transduction histidine kinase